MQRGMQRGGRARRCALAVTGTCRWRRSSSAGACSDSNTNMTPPVATTMTVDRRDQRPDWRRWERRSRNRSACWSTDQSGAPVANATVTWTVAVGRRHGRVADEHARTRAATRPSCGRSGRPSGPTRSSPRSGRGHRRTSRRPRRPGPPSAMRITSGDAQVRGRGVHDGTARRAGDRSVRESDRERDRDMVGGGWRHAQRDVVDDGRDGNAQVTLTTDAAPATYQVSAVVGQHRAGDVHDHVDVGVATVRRRRVHGARPLAAPRVVLYFILAARPRWPRVKCGGGSPHFFVLDAFLDMM